jgi:hypothetical protein
MPAEQMIAHDFDRLLAQWPGFFEQLSLHVDDIRKYGSLKQAIAEHEKRLADAKAKADEFEAEMGDKFKALQDEHASKHETLNAAIASRQTEIDNMVLAAKLDAENIKTAGKRAKEQVLAEARAIAATAEKRRDDANKAAEALEQSAIEKEAKIAGLDSDITAKQAELARITQIIADTKAKLG